MRNLVKKTLLISSLLISATVANHSYTDLRAQLLMPALPMQEGGKPAFSPRESAETYATGRAQHYMSPSKEQLDRRAKLIQRIAGKNNVFTLANVNTITDESYLFLTQSELIANKDFLAKALEDTLNIKLILEADADETGVLNLASDLITTSHLHLIDSAHVVKIIGQSFLVTNKSIQHIAFSGFKKVHTIESGFMLGSKVKSADLSSFERLTEIKDCFMSEAASLTNLKLPTTRLFNAELRNVGNHFLRGTSSLNHVQEEAFESVTTMGSYFMSGSALLSFNTAMLKNLEQLGVAFLAKCEELTDVNIAGLKRIEPKHVTQADVEQAQEAAKAAQLIFQANVKEAFAVHTDAKYLSQEAKAEKKAALKYAKTAMVVIGASNKENADKVRKTAKEKIYKATDALTLAETKDTEANRQVEMTKIAQAQAKAAKEKATTLLAAAKNNQRHNLEVLHGCYALGKKLNGLRGVDTLPRALRIELADRFGRPSWVDIEAGCLGF